VQQACLDAPTCSMPIGVAINLSGAQCALVVADVDVDVDVDVDGDPE
jgi:hypothetical protein